jgi:hypothetical protein
MVQKHYNAFVITSASGELFLLSLFQVNTVPLGLLTRLNHFANTKSFFSQKLGSWNDYSLNCCQNEPQTRYKNINLGLYDC